MIAMDCMSFNDIDLVNVLHIRIFTIELFIVVKIRNKHLANL